MPFCATCGTNMTGTFCPNCGTAAGAPPAAASGFTPPPPPPQGAQSAGLSDNAVCALCYLAGFITGIIFLVMAPYNTNKRVKFHAWQSIILSVAWIIFWMAISVVFGMLNFLSLVLVPLFLLLRLAGFLAWLFLMWKAYQGEDLEIPAISPLARQQAAK